MTAEDLQRLIDERTQESLYLEFKRGDALDGWASAQDGICGGASSRRV
jgi:hypothetical protein